MPKYFSTTLPLKFLNNLGPGLLYAGAAVGVSHLVMSTKAGASYEFLFILLIPLIHLVKYPFYKFGPQYTALTGKNILHGYFSLGKWALSIYVILTILSMCLIQASVTIVASSIAIQIFNLHLPAEYMPHVPATLVLLMVAAILYVGQYRLLDKSMKFIIIILSITTILALGLVIQNTQDNINTSVSPIFNLFEYSDILFLAAFIGWMPAPMDISVWHSVWSEESNRSNGKRISVNNAILDFNIGYIGTALLAMVFLSLGALLMYGSDEPPSANGAIFAGQFINLYTDALGSWAYPIIGFAALATMLSTTLTCLDAYPRTLKESYFIWKGAKKTVSQKPAEQRIYRLFLVLATMGTIVVFLIMKHTSITMGGIVTIATVVSFISAPLIAFINYKVMIGKTISKADFPNNLTKQWCLFGIMIMSVFSLSYIVLFVLN